MTSFEEWAAECAAVFPNYGRCGYRRGDEIHGPPEECGERDGEPCIKPAAHHDFMAPSTVKEGPR